MIKEFIESVGQYCLFLKMVFRKPEKWKIFWRQFLAESEKLILSSVLLVCVISLFIGGVLVIQIASNIENPFIDRMNVGYMLREILILEFCSTIVALILAGKMGSNISSEIGSMRITDQIDAMDMMGVNSAGFLALPKIVSATLLRLLPQQPMIVRAVSFSSMGYLRGIGLSELVGVSILPAEIFIFWKTTGS